MTWGEIRRILTKFAPGFDLRLITDYMNLAYEEFLDARDWKGLDAKGVITASAVYSTGTIAVAEGSKAVTGTGTVWTSAMSGRMLRVDGMEADYTFAYLSATTGELDREFEFDDKDDAGYRLFSHIFGLPQEVKFLTGVRGLTIAQDLERMTQDELDQFAPTRVVFGEPMIWAPGQDSDESSEPVLPSVELYPIPQYVRSFEYKYRKRPVGFDGSNAGNSPLPFVPAGYILERVKSEICTDRENFSAADRHRAACTARLAQVQTVETMRQGPMKLQLPDRYTRHNELRWNKFADSDNSD